MQREIVEAMARGIEADLCANAERHPGAIWNDERGREQCFVAAQATLTALEALGLVVVPREPTEAMIAAFDETEKVGSEYGCANVAECYRAMIAAALPAGEGATPLVVSQGWQDIASAPKDGTKIDLWVVEKVVNSQKPEESKHSAYRVENAWWGQPYGEYLSDHNRPKPPFQWCRDGSAYGEYWVEAVEEDQVWGREKEIHSLAIATHFMFLPAAPQGRG